MPRSRCASANSGKSSIRLDHSPFTERDLDDDAEAYIVGWAREVDTGVPFRIVVHLPAGEAEKARERNLESAMGNYLAYRVGMLERDLSGLLRVGRRSLLIGIRLHRAASKDLFPRYVPVGT